MKLRRNIKRILSFILVVTMLCSTTIQGYADDNTKTEYKFGDMSLAMHSSDGEIKLNEEKVKINGDIYSEADINYTGESDNYVLEGNELAGTKGAVCEITDYVDLINASADYDFVLEKDSSYSNSDLNLDESSLYVDGNVVFDGTSIEGTGNITASGDISMNIGRKTVDNEGVIIMSQEGDITINSSKLTFSGLIYAPNGSVVINSKKIDFKGAIYAEKIEINGTELSMEYADYLPDDLVCDAGEDKTIYIEDGVQLITSCNYDNAKISFSVDESKQKFVEITDGNTLAPALKFSEPGEYELTMTVALNNTTATDTVNVIVKAEPVVTYTSTDDFNNGEATDVSGEGDKLKLASLTGETENYSVTYNEEDGRGISVDFTQSKTMVHSTEDNLELEYSLNGYGKVEYEKGNDMILLVDNSGSTSQHINMLKQAAVNILEYMGPNDRFGLSDLGKIHVNLTTDKEVLTNAINRCNSGSGSSDYVTGIDKYALEMFDFEETDRDRYILVLADGENGILALDTVAQRAADLGVKVIAFQINVLGDAFGNNYVGYGMQEMAAKTKGFYKLSVDADEIASSMNQFASEVYNLAGNDVVFTTTITDSSYLDSENMEKAPVSIISNEDGSVTLTWKYSGIEIDKNEKINIPVKTQLLTDAGYKVIAKDTKLTYYDRNGKGTIINLEDVVVGNNGYATKGQWTSKVYDSGKEGCTWSLVSWNADYVGNSSMDVYLSVSDDGEKFSEPVKVDNNQELKGLKGKYIKTEVKFEKSEDGETPVLYDLTVYSQDGKNPDNTLLGSRVKINCDSEAYTNMPITTILDIVSDNASVTDVTWSITGSENVRVKGEDDLIKKLIFVKAGTYTITAEVKTEDKMASKASVNIEVKEQPSIDKETIGETTIPNLEISLTETPEVVKNGTAVSFNISYSDPTQVAWSRVTYYASNNNASPHNRRAAYIDKEGNVTISYGFGSVENTVIVEAFDKYGNSTKETFKVYFDGKKPTVKLTSTAGRMYVYTSATLTATATDDYGVASAVLTINDEEVQLDENGQYVFTSIVPGTYTAKYVVTDMAGYIAETTYTIVVNDDTTRPQCTLYTTNVTLGNSTEITATVSDNHSGLKSFELTINGEPVETINAGNNKYTYKFTPEELGTYEVVLQAVDYNGNVNSATRTIQCTPDTGKPSVSIKLSNAEVIVGDDITVSVTATDNVAVTELYFYEDGVEKKLSDDNTYIYTADDENLNTSGHKYVTFYAIARDNAGNEKTYTRMLKVIKEDTQDPAAGISCNTRISIYSNTYVMVSASDNIAVAEKILYVNGEEVELDSSNRYKLPTDDFYTYDIKLVVTDTSGNVVERTLSAAVVDMTNPSISISRNKSTFVMGDTAIFTVKVSDNYQLAEVVATYDGQVVESALGEFVCEISDITAGSHRFEIVATDTSGNSRTSYYAFTVADTEAPTVTISSDKEKYAVEEKPVIEYVIDDNVGVTTVEAYINDEIIEYADGVLALPETFAPGKYTISVKATDAAGNTSQAECSFEVMKSSDVVCPSITECIVSPAHWQVGEKAYITVGATDDSGKVKVTLSYAGEELEYDELNDRFEFVPDKEGYAEIRIHAEDETGNYTEATMKKYVYQSIEEHKLKVTAESVISVNEETTITLSSTDNYPFVQTSVFCNTTGKELTGENNVYTFSSDTLGEYKFTATGIDEEGITDTKEFVITVASQYEAEVNSAAMKQYLETTAETELTAEMMEVAKGFETPVDAYSYVINNIKYECYVNSRRGAVGAFETNYGNDYDQASLLIAFFREMGYPARYGSGNITLTEEQLKSLFAAEDYTSVCQMFSNAGKNPVMSSFAKTLKFDQIWTEVYVPYSMTGVTDETYKDLGVWVKLDTAIKASELETYTSSLDEPVVDFSAYDEMLTKYESTDVASLVSELQGNEMPDTVSERVIKQQEFTVLPSELQYTVNSEKSTFANVTDAMSDRVSFTISDILDSKRLGTYRTADLYNKRISIQYVGDTGKATIFEMSSSQVAYNTFKPALTIDGEIVGYGPETTLGNKQELYVSITGSATESFVDELKAGSMYSVMLDTGRIATQTYEKLFDEAITENPMEENEKAPTATSYYSEAQIGSYLAYAGALYFMNCDRYEYVNECKYNVESSSRTKCAVLGYNVNFEENSWGMYTKVLPGRFFIDVNLNTSYAVSRTGETDLRNKFMFASSMIGSYFEGSIWETLLFHKGVSTVHIFANAVNQGNSLVPVYDFNYDEQMANLTYLDSASKTDIKNAVNQGYCVLIPDGEVTIENWKGTGYMIADLENYNYFVYRVSGGINGGSASDVDALDQALERGLTYEFFQENGIDYDDFYCNTFSVCQSLYGILMIREVSQLSLNMYTNTLVSLGETALGTIIKNSTETYDKIDHFSSVFGYYTDMLDSILDYADESIDGVRKITSVFIQLVCELTGVESDLIGELLSAIVGAQNNDVDAVADASINAGKYCLTSLLEDIVKEYIDAL